MRVVAGPPERIGGLRVTVIELFEDAVSVHWHFDSRVAMGPRGEALAEELEWEPSPFAIRPPRTSDLVDRMATPLVALQDEAGTEYSGFRCEEVRDSPDVIGRSGFVPGPPETARGLAVVIEDVVLLLDP